MVSMANSRLATISSPTCGSFLNNPNVSSGIARLGEQLRYVSHTVEPDVREVITPTTTKVLECEQIYTNHCDSAKQAGVREQVADLTREGGSTW